MIPSPGVPFGRLLHCQWWCSSDKTLLRTQEGTMLCPPCRRPVGICSCMPICLSAVGQLHHYSKVYADHPADMSTIVTQDRAVARCGVLKAAAIFSSLLQCVGIPTQLGPGGPALHHRVLRLLQHITKPNSSRMQSTARLARGCTPLLLKHTFCCSVARPDRHLFLGGKEATDYQFFAYSVTSKLVNILSMQLLSM